MQFRLTLPPDGAQLAERFGVKAWTADPSQDRCRSPGDLIWAITHDEDLRRMQTIRWGLVPSWSKWAVQTDSSAALANRSFRYLLKRRRCVIPAAAYSRFSIEPRQPLAEHKLLYSVDGRMLALAGIYDVRIDPSGELMLCCAILTVPAYGRGREEDVPIVLPAASIDDWLSGLFLDDSAVDDLVGTLAERQPKHLMDSIGGIGEPDIGDELRPVSMRI